VGFERRHKMRIRTFHCFGILISALVVLPASGIAQDAKQVYLNKCSVCHGEDGAGQTAKGKKLKMKDIRSADVQKQTPQQWADAIFKGVGQDMDAFGKELGADMSRKLADYMRELSKTPKK
jgi:mono/diheme cytochrome c family protein